MNPAETRQITLTEFLLARIAEDEAGAQTGRNDHWRVEGGETWEHQGRPYKLVGGGKHLATFDVDHGTLPSIHIARWSPARVLAECEAKRRIVAEAEKCDGAPRGGWCYGCDVALRAHAAVYSDHSDYRDEWRP